MFVYILVITAFLSISVYEGFVILGVIYVIYGFLHEGRRRFKGALRIPLVIYIFSTVFPTLLFFPKMFIKSISEGIFQLIYFLNSSQTEARRILKKLTYIFVLLGILGLPLVTYNALKRGEFKLFWGGSFEVAQFYTIFAFSALVIAFYEYGKHRKLNVNAVFYTLLFLVFLGVVVASARRSYLIGVIPIYILLTLVLSRNRLISTKFVLINGLALILGAGLAYGYLSQKDYRFKALNEVLLGKRKMDERVLNIISSSRYAIMLDGIEIIEDTFKKRRWDKLILGYGIRSGLYLPHKRSPKTWQRYESIILVSELIERGVVGLLSILAIYFIAFKRFLKAKLNRTPDILYLIGFMPLLIHLIASIFTFFWDALLPLYLVLFRLSEISTEAR